LVAFSPLTLDRWVEALPPALGLVGVHLTVCPTQQAVDSAKPTLDRASFSLAIDPIRAGFGEAHSASDVNEGLGDALTSM